MKISGINIEILQQGHSSGDVRPRYNNTIFLHLCLYIKSFYILNNGNRSKFELFDFHLSK